MFLSTPLREGRLRMADLMADAISFLSTPLREGRRQGGRSRIALQRFYPRPCVRGDEARHRLMARIVVSIHAPA